MFLSTNNVSVIFLIFGVHVEVTVPFEGMTLLPSHKIHVYKFMFTLYNFVLILLIYMSLMNQIHCVILQRKY